MDPSNLNEFKFLFPPTPPYIYRACTNIVFCIAISLRSSSPPSDIPISFALILSVQNKILVTITIRTSITLYFLERGSLCYHSSLLILHFELSSETILSFAAFHKLTTGLMMLLLPSTLTFNTINFLLVETYIKLRSGSIHFARYTG